MSTDYSKEENYSKRKYQVHDLGNQIIDRSRESVSEKFYLVTLLANDLLKTVTAQKSTIKQGFAITVPKNWELI